MRSQATWNVLVVVAAALVLLVVWGADAWVGEDAHITLRTVDNFVNGHGLRWNVDERVQTFTHPLWLMVVAIPYSVTREIFWTVTALSLLFSVGAFLVLAFAHRRSPVVVSVALLLPLLACRSLHNFATSGFENPLGFLLLSLFAVALRRTASERPVPWLSLSLLVALGVTNRMDTALLYAPACLYLLWAHRSRVGWGRCVLGALPLVLWTGFSLVYYGFAVPNTAPAKLSPMPGTGWYLSQGVRDLLLLCTEDPAAMGILLFGIVATVAHLRATLAERGARESGPLAALGLGMVLYCAYVVRVGGDFIIGRFWTYPLWVGLILVAASAEPAVRWLRARGPRTGLAFGLGAGAVLLAGFLGAREALGAFPPGPVIERSIARASLRGDMSWEISEAARAFREQGEMAARLAALQEDRVVVPMFVIGFAGMAAGPDVTIIDQYGLGDPLLARLRPVEAEKVGHLRRAIPRGYLEARQIGELGEMHPALRDYYAQLRVLTRDPVWSWQRLKTIAAFNLGAYDHLLEEYELSVAGD